MSVNHTIAGSFIVAVGLVVTSAASADPPRKPDVEQRRVEKPKPVDLNVVKKLIAEKAKDQALRTDLMDIANKLGQFKDPSIVGAWGLGCGGACASADRRWNDMPAAKRLEAINAAKTLSVEDRALLVGINTSIENVGKRKKDMVGAWGLGCGGSCSRPMEQLGDLVAAQPGQR